MSRETEKGRAPATRRTTRALPVLGVALVAAIVALKSLSGRGPRTPPAPPAPVAAATFVGREACADCHAEETQRFTGSHHDLAMQVADEKAVLGDFGGVGFVYAGVTSRFHRRDGKFLVTTDGPDGKLHDYEVAYTFGVTPLQQYLIAMPGGRLQALGVAWDARPRAAGGQRWFHLHPGERVGHDDVLHWTKPSQNWNDRCADCHSTNLRKGYDLAQDRYATTWSELDVSCEACHGPASAHVAGARAGRPGELVVPLERPTAAAWVFDGGSLIARREPPLASRVELETCAPCHSRRGELADDAVPGRPLLDGYRPALLGEGLYFADGQIEDEVYEWGSFLQSRMHRAGVTCSDCHDPHALTLRAEGNALCARCHLPAHFDTPAHHLHPAGSRAAECVVCHMPARTYMVVDTRRDHGFRVPRPDLDARLGVPDACTSCHADRTPAWAAEAIRRRPGAHRAGTPHFGEALAAGRRGTVGAERALLGMIARAEEPAIARATAVSLLAEYASLDALTAVRRAAGDADPLLRLASVDALEGRDPRAVAEIAGPLLDDRMRAVRLAAVHALAGSPALDPSLGPALVRGIEEYRAAERANADRPESHLNLGLLALRTGQAADAEREFETAIRLAPYFVPAYVNLADLYRAQGRDADGERVLRRALAVAEGPEVHHALGLLLVRQRRTAEALAELREAAAGAPEHVRYAYVLGVALHSIGDTKHALEVLRAAHERRPGDRDVLVALATISRDAGDIAAARRWSAALVEAAPSDDGAARLRAELGGP